MKDMGNDHIVQKYCQFFLASPIERNRQWNVLRYSFILRAITMASTGDENDGSGSGNIAIVAANARDVIDSKSMSDKSNTSAVVAPDANNSTRSANGNAAGNQGATMAAVIGSKMGNCCLFDHWSNFYSDG